mmetsp:Transcript_84181/g.271482  ORF Transcript_84181/g.271482 Transcript_84181/m.271482 type:complete len:366 (-) Transcript_84181:105-1202(-)
MDDCSDLAIQARGLYRTSGDVKGEATASLMMAKAYMASGQNVQGLRAAEDASRLWRAAGDLPAQVDALVLIADAKLSICEERGGQTAYATMTSIVRSAEIALADAKAHRAGDRACLGAALTTYSRVLLKIDSFKGAWVSAKAASRAFRKVGDNLGRARALLLWSEADLYLGYYNESRNNAQQALAAFTTSGNEDGKAKALAIEEQIDRALGIPTQAELAEQQRRQLQYQQQHFMLMQQQQAMMGNQQQMQMQMQQFIPEEEERAVAASGPGAFKRTGASPLQVSAGMDVAVIRKKISELAMAIIGDGEDVEVDTPLLEAGLTSNTAVVLRDELSKDLPGIKLPPTLIFDYPSISSMADYVVEQAR